MKNYKIKTINNIAPESLDLFTENFAYSPDEENPDALILRSQDLHDYDFTENIRFIGRAGAGVNNIPVEKCSELGIVVSKAPGANANAVKELTAAALLLASRDIVGGIDWVRTLKGEEDIAQKVEKGKKAFTGPELAGKKLGVIGLGATGQLVGEMGLSFGMEVYGYDPFISLSGALNLSNQIHYSEDGKMLFKECDYISLHIPYSEETKNIVSRDLLAQVKPGLRLLNIARGGLVDLEALKEALEDGRVAKYVVDFPEETSLGLPNTINIPHLGASTPESQENSAKMVIEQAMDYLNNGNIKNSVNFPDCDMGQCTSAHRVTLNHRNIPNMIGQITAILAEEGVNIANLLNRHKDGWAYTMIDLDSEIPESLRKKLWAIEGVVRVRLIK